MQPSANRQSAQFYRAIKVIAAATAAVVVFGASAAAGSMVSYDASGNALPSGDIRYLDTTHLTGPEVLPSVSGGVLSLGPTTTAGYSFWYTDTLTIDHTQTTDISARLKLVSESSTSPDRAGLAIAFTDDRDLYQDLFITPTGVFFDKLADGGTQRVQDTFFPVNTTVYHTYDLNFSGDTVNLKIDGTPDLTSSVFDVSGTGEVVLPDFVSFGDISTSAQSSFALTSFSVSEVPEPSYAVPTLLAVAGLVASQRPRQNSKSS